MRSLSVMLGQGHAKKEFIIFFAAQIELLREVDFEKGNSGSGD